MIKKRVKLVIVFDLNRIFIYSFYIHIFSLCIIPYKIFVTKVTTTILFLFIFFTPSRIVEITQHFIHYSFIDLKLINSLSFPMRNLVQYSVFNIYQIITSC